MKTSKGVQPLTIGDKRGRSHPRVGGAENFLRNAEMVLTRSHLGCSDFLGKDRRV